MFAVVKTGGKQYKVTKDDVIRVERLDAEPGDTIALEDVLLVGDGDKSTLGQPTVAGAFVAAEVLEQARGRKILVFKKKRRKGYRRLNGHRQDLTVLRVTEILTDGKKPAQAKKVTKAEKTDLPKEATGAKKTAAEKATPKAAAPKTAQTKTATTKETETKTTAPARKSAAKKPAAMKAGTTKTGAPKSGGAKSDGAKATATKKTAGTKKTAAAKKTATKKTAAAKKAGSAKSTAKKSEE